MASSANKIQRTRRRILNNLEARETVIDDDLRGVRQIGKKYARFFFMVRALLCKRKPDLFEIFGFRFNAKGNK